MRNEDYDLEYIIENYNESIFVTDHTGKVIYANPAASKILDIPLDRMIGYTVTELINQGYYDNSPVLKVIETKEEVIGVLNTRTGKQLIVSSRPFFNNKGELTMVLSSSIEKSILHKFISILEFERSEKNKYLEEVHHLRGIYFDDGEVVAQSSLMKKVILEASNVATTDSTVILYGESGTGKDVIAKYIHRLSKRKDAAFISVNCAAIPENLMESELFGYEKGAFTGADKKGKHGLFEIADKGTLFLDEIAELPLYLQPKLLRVIESGEVRRIGATVDKKVDVRLIAATNKNLKQMVENNLFREDLFYRINVIPISIPPLRDRPEDILVLAQKFLDELNTKYKTNKFFGPQISDSLRKYHWPGNVRELKNIVERLFITSPGLEMKGYDNVIIPHEGRLTDEGDLQLSTDLSVIENSMSPNADNNGKLKEFIAEAEKYYIEKVIDECNGSISEAANKLGIHRSVLYRKRKSYGK